MVRVDRIFLLLLTGLGVAVCHADASPRLDGELLDQTVAWALSPYGGGKVDQNRPEWAQFQEMLQSKEIPAAPFILEAVWYTSESALHRGTLQFTWTQRAVEPSPVRQIVFRVDGGQGTSFELYQEPVAQGYIWEGAVPLTIAPAEGLRGSKETDIFDEDMLKLTVSRQTLEKGLEVQFADDAGQRSNWFRVQESPREPEFDYGAFQTSAIHVLLNSPIPEFRGAAARALWSDRSGHGPEAISALIKALEDSSTEVQGMAARALGSFGADAADAVPRMAELAKSEDHSLQTAALAGLEGIGPAASGTLDTLEGLMRSSSPATRCHAAQAAIAITREPEPYIGLIASTLRSKDYAQAVIGLGRLGPLGEGAVLELIALLHEKPFWPSEIVKDIAEIGARPTESVDALLEIVKPMAADSAVETRGWQDEAIRALGSFPTERERTTPVLLRLLDMHGGRAFSAMVAFARLGYPESELAPTLSRFTRSEEEAERLGAFFYLATVSADQRSAAYLDAASEAVTNDDSYVVRQQAIAYAGEIAGQSEHRGEALQVLAAGAVDPYGENALAAVRQLSKYVKSNPDDVVGPLAAALSGRHYEVVRTAAEALARVRVEAPDTRARLEELREAYRGSVYEEWDEEFGLRPLPEVIDAALGEAAPTASR